MDHVFRHRMGELVSNLGMPELKVKCFGTVRRADGTIKIDDPVENEKRLREEREMLAQIQSKEE